MEVARWVELTGVDNMRDLGGLRVRGGATTRLGCTFRASTLQELTIADLDVIGAIGLRTVIDLRMPDEAAREGHGLLAGQGVRVVNLPVAVVEPAQIPLLPDGRRADIPALYAEMLAGSGTTVTEIARIVADLTQHAVVFHCAAGKDRTGIVAAVLLDAIGVEPDAIIADYALTGLRLPEIRQRLRTLPSYRDDLPPGDDDDADARPETMRGFLDLLHDRHGGGADWLLANGLTADELDRLRQALVPGTPG